MHHWLVIVAFAAITGLSCSRAPLSAHDAAVVEVAVDSGPVLGEIVVMKEGSGRGTVFSSPGGITCGGTCVATFAGPAVVTLSAIPDANSVFSGWSGECQGIDACTIHVSATHAVTASFAAQEHSLVVGHQGPGRGRVTSFPPRIDCGPTCTANVETGLTVVLSAMAEGDAVFTGWSGDCSGSGACTLVLDEDRTAIAHFNPVTQGLHVAKSGTGAGRVTSLPAGIDCGTNCTASFTPGTDITLQAWPDTTSNFTGWSGLCQGAETCVLRMSSSGSVTADFEIIQHGLSIEKTGTGSGTVKATPTGIASYNSCAANHAAGTLVMLTATPDETSVFTGWSGACTGTGECTITMDAAKTVNANFEAIHRLLAVSKTGNGEVTSVPSGIKCGDACDADFVIGAHVLLQAWPGPGSTFAGWSGACAGSDTCTLIMDDDRSVSASFR